MSTPKNTQPEITRLFEALSPLKNSPHLTLEINDSVLVIDWAFAYHFDSMFLNITWDGDQYQLDYQDMEDEHVTVKRSVDFEGAVAFATERIEDICGTHVAWSHKVADRV